MATRRTSQTASAPASNAGPLKPAVACIGAAATSAFAHAACWRVSAWQGGGGGATGACLCVSVRSCMRASFLCARHLVCSSSRVVHVVSCARSHHYFHRWRRLPLTDTKERVRADSAPHRRSRDERYGARSVARTTSRAKRHTHSPPPPCPPAHPSLTPGPYPLSPPFFHPTPSISAPLLPPPSPNCAHTHQHSDFAAPLPL